MPLFLIAPRSGAAALTRSGGGPTNFIGFSENVTLGQIGSLKQDDGLVMRVRIENDSKRLAACAGAAWRSTNSRAMVGENRTQARKPEPVTERGGFFQVGTTESLHRLTTQTFFLEPLESPVLFAAPRVVAVQGDLPFVRLDAEGSIQSRRHDFERLMYKAISDTDEPRMEELRNDMRPYPAAYLSLPATARKARSAHRPTCHAR